MEEKKHRRIREQKHSSIWILVIVIIIAILTITSIFIDNKKFQKNVDEKKKLEQELEKVKQENKDRELREKQEQEKQKAYQEEQSKKEEIKEINSKNSRENKTQKELSQDIQNVIDKSNEKWNNSEKDRANNALELVKKHLGNGDYAYNLMDKISNNIYMVVVLDNNTREVIGYYYSDIEKNIVVKEE